MLGNMLWVSDCSKQELLPCRLNKVPWSELVITAPLSRQADAAVLCILRILPALVVHSLQQASQLGQSPRAGQQSLPHLKATRSITYRALMW